MVATVGERGYGKTRVADVIDVAGVSRNAFYRHFDNRLDCFIQTLDGIVAAVESAMVAELEGEGAWDERLRGCFQALVDLVIAQPAAARLCLVEAYVAGPEAVEHVDRMARGVGRRAVAIVEESPERAGMPPGVARAVLGGMRKMVQARLYTGRERELPELAPQLVDWALSYRTPPEPLPKPRERPPAPARPGRDREDPRQRILDAMTTVVAEKGYAAATITDLASAAAVSLTTFYDRFDSKQTAFLAALDDAVLGMLELALPAYREAEDWPHGVRDALERLLAHLTHEPTTAQFVAEAVWAGGPAALARVDESMAGFQALIAEGLRRRSPSSSIAAEAIGSSILALAYDDLTRNGPECLYEMAPTASFVALAPAIGTIEACAVVNDR
jgi:AcrR family transcriptional regulator